MEKENGSSSFIQIDFFRLWFVFLKLKYVILAIVALTIIGTVVYSDFICVPRYTSVAKLYIFRSSEEDGITTTDFSVGSYFSSDYMELMTDSTVLNKVKKELDFDIKYSELSGGITLSDNNTGRIINVYATNTNPERAKKIADKVCEVSKEKIVELMGVELVNVISEGTLPSTPSYPNKTKNFYYGLLIAVLLSLSVLLVAYKFNNKINGQNDVERYLGLCTLAAIPYNNSKRHRESKKKKNTSKG